MHPLAAVRPAPAAAVLALLLAAEPAAAFVRETTSAATGSLCLWWDSRAVTYEVNAAAVTGTGCSTPSAAAAAIVAGMEPWALASTGGSTCTDFHFQGGATSTRNQVANDGVNLIVVRTKRCSDATGIELQTCWPDDLGLTTIGYTTVFYDPATGRVLDADIEIFARDAATGYGHYLTCADPSAPTCSPPNAGTTCNQVDLASVVTHEAGHVLGLAHVSETSSVMAPQTGNVGRRALAADDVAGICTIYPKGAATLSCAPPPAKKSSGGCGTASGAGLLAPLALLGWVGAIGRRRGRGRA